MYNFGEQIKPDISLLNIVSGPWDGQLCIISTKNTSRYKFWSVIGVRLIISLKKRGSQELHTRFSRVASIIMHPRKVYTLITYDNS